VPESTDIGADLLKLMACPDLASRRWIWEQYDSQVGGDTLQKAAAMRQWCASTAPARRSR
jgi:phosphoribosylformylglycinamidine (FGAM) synthase-like enzyme